MPEDCNSIKKESLAEVLSCQFCEIFKSNIFDRTPRDDCFYRQLKFSLLALFPPKLIDDIETIESLYSLKIHLISNDVNFGVGT